ncbi:MAG: fatty acid desaturase [Anaerolineales bacterium]|jgi:omega-6 fatty acid desaturase (delta-12 desaturase)|nr:fatty acid desaturase [Anaerolineales bacterium]MCW5888041.1 fatty acid desaturase [Anaerolineales bacterium]
MQTTKPKTKPAWIDAIKPYQVPDHKKSVWQLINSLVPYLVIWVLMYYSLRVNYLLTLALAFLNALFMMRLFIIQHDCGHNSFFKSTKLNDLVGGMLGLISMTPYHHWRRTHAKHHATSGDLDFRGIGDIYTMTVDEYAALPWHRKLTYRIYRNPLVKFIVGPTLLFVVLHRFVLSKDADLRERRSVRYTNIALALILAGLSAWIGFNETVLIWLPIMVFGSSIGVFLFYVQHQFEDTYWRWHEQWDYTEAALRGASFFKMNKVAQWFSGNIGFHHVHHLSPKIPNYNLERAHYENEIFHQVVTITFWSSFKTIFLHLWDEQTHKLISWTEYHRQQKQRAAGMA